MWASAVVVHGFSCPMACGIYLDPNTKHQTPVPCIGRWILNHWTTRDALLPISYTNVACTTNIALLPIFPLNVLEIVLSLYGDLPCSSFFNCIACHPKEESEFV